MINKAFNAKAQIDIARFNAKNEMLNKWLDKYYHYREVEGLGHFEAMVKICEKLELYGATTERIDEVCDFIEEMA